MQSAQGDFLGQGNDYAYSRPQDQVWANLGYNQSVIYGTVNGLNGDRWTAEFAAPDSQPLQVGDYPNAQGAPFQQPGYPGIQVNDGFTCQTITGQFDVRDIEYTNGVLTRLDVTFEEYCNGAAAGLTGEFIYTPPPPLPPLALTVKVDRLGTVNSTYGYVTASGTVTCNQYVWTTLSVELNQGNGSNPAIGSMSLSCSPGSAAKWNISATPYTPFPSRSHHGKCLCVRRGRLYRDRSDQPNDEQCHRIAPTCLTKATATWRDPPLRLPTTWAGLSKRSITPANLRTY